MIKRIAKISSFLFVLTFWACQPDLETTSFINLDSQFEVYLTQTLTDEGAQPAINIKSIQPYECSNGYISYEVTASEGYTTCHLNEVSHEGTCMEEMTTISEMISLDLKEASNRVNFRVQNVVNNWGFLDISDNTFELNLQSNNGLKLSKTNINKIQPGMIWGHYKMEENSDLTSLFDLLLLIDHNNKLLGDYGYFYIDHSGDEVIYGIDTDEYQTFFVYTESEVTSFESFEQEILKLKEENPSLILSATNNYGQTINIQ